MQIERTSHWHIRRVADFPSKDVEDEPVVVQQSIPALVFLRNGVTS